MGEITVISYWNPPIHDKRVPGADLIIQRDILWHVIPETVFLHEGAECSIITQKSEILRQLPGLPKDFNEGTISIYPAAKIWTPEVIDKVGSTIVKMTNRYREKFRWELPWLPVFYQPASK
ncbi:MAG TPA: hypothetical protein VFB59_05085 [Candidatus Saccharimonadales bacterium]|nr:hypothetical protein [Candidatus Saccharimonadales bacterium]